MKNIFWNIIPWAIIAFIAFHNQPVEGCLCQPAHPQTHFCNADFVAIVRPLKRSHRLVAENVVYKVEVKKTYKINPKAHEMLKHGRIITSAYDSLCGVNLELGRLYMIAGKAGHLNLCDYIYEYQKMSIVERRLFSKSYRNGCKCQIHTCFKNRCPMTDTATTCNWVAFSKCATDYSACLPKVWSTPEGNITKCHWQRTSTYKKCIANP